MSAKFYLTQNCNRQITLGSTIFEFEPVGLNGGAWQGVYCAETAADQAAMVELMKDPTNAVAEIQVEEYNHKRVGKPDYANNYSPIPQLAKDVPRPTPAKIIDKPGVVVVEQAGPEHQVEPKPTSDPVADDAVLQTGTVAPTEPSTTVQKVKAAVKNAIRAKAPKQVTPEPKAE